MSAHRVSVVVAAYNSERYVASAVRSVVAQTHPDVEIIVVDDGSTDRTPAVLEQFGNRITVVRQANRGIGGARNAGVRVATGDVIALLDADDEWLPERAARCVDLLASRPDVGFVTTDAVLVDDAGIPTGETYLDQVPFPDSAFAAEIVQRNFVWSGAFVRRSVLDAAGPFDESRPLGADDYDMWLRLIAEGVTPGIVREPLARYRMPRRQREPTRRQVASGPKPGAGAPSPRVLAPGCLRSGLPGASRGDDAGTAG